MKLNEFFTRVISQRIEAQTGITTVEGLQACTDEFLLKINSFGKKNLANLRAIKPKEVNPNAKADTVALIVAGIEAGGEAKEAAIRELNRLIR